MRIIQRAPAIKTNEFEPITVKARALTERWSANNATTRKTNYCFR